MGGVCMDGACMDWGPVWTGGLHGRGLHEQGLNGLGLHGIICVTCSVVARAGVALRAWPEKVEYIIRTLF